MATAKQRKLGARRKRDQQTRQKQEELFEQAVAEMEEEERLAKEEKKQNKGKKKLKEPKPKPAPHATWYDKNGVRVGDDNFPMTKTRTRMHRIFNVFFIWCIICILTCLALAILSFWQGQKYTFFDLIAYGGNSYNGFSVASMMRLESLILLFIGPISMAMSFTGFSWFYDDKPVTRVNVLGAINFILALGLMLTMAITVHIPEPMSITTLILVIAFFLTKREVIIEKPRLKKTRKHRAEFSRF